MLHQLAVLLLLVLVPTWQAGGQAAGAAVTTTLTIELKADGRYGGEVQFDLGEDPDRVLGSVYTMDLPFRIEGAIVAKGLEVSTRTLTLRDWQIMPAPAYTQLTLRDIDPRAPERKASFQIRPTLSWRAEENTRFADRPLARQPDYMVTEDTSSALAIVQRNLYLRLGKPRTDVDRAIAPTVLVLWWDDRIAPPTFFLLREEQADRSQNIARFLVSRLEENPLIVDYALPIPDARRILLALLPVLLGIIGCPTPLVLAEMPDLIRHRRRRIGIAMGIALLALVGGGALWAAGLIREPGIVVVMTLCLVTLIAVPLKYALQGDSSQAVQSPLAPSLGALSDLSMEDLQKNLQITRRTHAILENQLAIQTEAYAKPEVIIGIEDTKQRIEAINQELALRRQPPMQVQASPA